MTSTQEMFLKLFQVFVQYCTKRNNFEHNKNKRNWQTFFSGGEIQNFVFQRKT